MGSWSLTGVVLVIGFFFTALAFLLAQIDVVNPISGIQQSIFSVLLDWILPF